MLKLSDAIVLGSMAHPKACFYRHAADGSKCALGAAESAIGINDYASFGVTQRTWPILNEYRVHPVTRLQDSVVSIITTLNNGVAFPLEFTEKVEFEPWTREAVAEWVAGVERELEMAASLTSEAAVEATPLPEAVHAQ